MNKFSYTALLSLFIIISNLISPSTCDQQTQDLINQICRTTSDFSFCSDILNRNLVSPITDLPGLTRLTTSLSVSIAKDTQTYIQKAKAAERDPNVQQLYGLCESDYNKVVGFLEGADNDAKRGYFKSMVNLLQLNGKPIILCQNAISGVVPIMREKNRKMRVLLTMGLYEGSLL